MKYPGVYKTKAGSYRCILQWRNEVHHLGTASNAEAAALIRDRVARHLGCPREMLIFPSRRLKALSVEDAKDKLSRDAKARTPGRYLGVQKTRTGTYRCVIQWKGEVHCLGAAKEQATALEIRDRVARHLGCPPRMLNFPDRKLRPLSVTAAQNALLRDTKSRRTSRYYGVARIAGSPLWQAYLGGPENRIHLGRWPTQRAAAIARDRAALHYKRGSRLNFPKMKLKPATADELLRETRARRSESTSSRFTGVYYNSAVPGRPWAVQLDVDGEIQFLGNWEGERDAAIAYDRAHLYFGGAEAPNLPRASKKLGEASPQVLRDEAILARKERTSSRYFGVSWAANTRKWEAFVTLRPRRKVSLGHFEDEQAAARARDRVAIEHFGYDIRLNFHPTTGEELRGKLPADDVTTNQCSRARPRARPRARRAQR